jgi:serine protease Do
LLTEQRPPFKEATVINKIFFLAALIFVAPLSSASEGAMIPSSFRDTVALIKSSVVNISTVRNVKAGVPLFGGDPFFDRFFGGQGQGQGQGGDDGNGQGDGSENGNGGGEETFQSRSLGSGVIIDAKNGYVLTNNHVVEGADVIKVKLSDSRELDGEIVGRDPKTDLAVLRIKNATGLSAASFGDSDAMEVGDWVLAVGSPFGLEQTVSHGIISAKGRVIGEGPYDDFLQTDAPINPGNSGGPLVNLNGEVIGINTAITSRSGGSEGIGFAIPSNVARKIYGNLIKDGKVTRGWLGVQIQDLEPDLATYFSLPAGIKGVVVSDVMPDGPAIQAGMREGDVITDFNGHKVESVHELQRSVAEAPVGQPMPVRVWRNGAYKVLSIKIGDMASFDTETAKVGVEKARAKLGLVVRSLSPAEMGEGKAQNGVVVDEVQQGSAADDAGIQPGDLITEFNKVRVNSPSEFANLAKDLKAGQSVVIKLRRGDSNLYLSLHLPDTK